MEQNNVVDINAARAAQSETLVADGTDLALQAKAQLPVLPTEAHVMDLLITGGMGAAVGYLAQPTMQGAIVGLLAGSAFGLAEKAFLGRGAGVADSQRMVYTVAALGTTIGAGYLSYQWR